MNPPEPTIIVNGVLLSEGQALTLRVALTAFMFDVRGTGLGDDPHGKEMARNYIARAEEISVLMHRSNRK